MQQLLQTANTINTTVIKITVIRVSFRRIKVIEQCTVKNPNVNGLYISYVASICVMSSILMFITSSDIKAI